MGCACAKRRAEKAAAAKLERDGGVIVMATQPGCTRRYHGRHAGAKVYVVGIGTEHETIFAINRASEASRLAKEHDVMVHRVAARDLCHDAVYAVFGA